MAKKVGALLSAMAVVCAAWGYQVRTDLASGSNIVVEGEAGETLDLDAVGNTAAHIYWLKRGTTVKLSAPAVDGVCMVQANLHAKDQEGADGDFTVDASEADGCTTVRWLGHVMTAGKVTVKGADQVVFGTATLLNRATTRENALLSVGDFGFDASVAAPRGLVLTNSAAFAARTVSCPWSIADGARFATIAGEPWVGTEGEPFVVDGFDLLIGNLRSFRSSAIHVKDGYEATFRHCFLQPVQEKTAYEFWRWGGSDGTLALPIVLDGENAGLYSLASQIAKFSGAISGNGYFRTGGTGEYVGFTGDLSAFTGSMHMAAKDSGITVYGPYLHELVWDVASVSKPMRFLPDGAGSVPTAARVDRVTGLSNTNNRLDVQPLQTVTIGELTGSLLVDGDASALLVVEKMPADAVIRLRGGVRLQVLEAGAGASIILGAGSEGAPGDWGVSGPAAGPAVKLALSQQFTGGTLTLGGQLDVGDLGADFTRVTLAPGTVQAGLASDVDVVFQGGALVEQAQTGWQGKLGLWLDASDPSTMQFVRELSWAGAITTGTDWNGNELVHAWMDRRSDQRSCLARNGRFSSASDYDTPNYKKVFPGLVENGLNGRSYLTFAHGNSPRLSLVTGLTSSKMAPVQTKWAILVFGSQNASPGTLLASDGAVLARTAGRDNPLFNDARYADTALYVDGAAADPTARKVLNGGWQIISFDAKDALVNGLNGTTCPDYKSVTSPGNANYAEILLFTETPTDDERRQAEKYLADKWGIAIAHAGAPLARQVSGSGRLTLQGGTALAGSFAGTVELNGQRLVVEEGEYPPTAAEIPSGNRTLWVDPSLDGALLMSDDPDRPLEIVGVLPRDNAGLATATNAAGLYSPIKDDGTVNRRTHLSAGSRGGAAATWLDFAGLYPEDDNAGNNLMICHQGAETRPEIINTDATWKTINYKTAFVVMDSSRGGGTPFTHYAGAASGDIIGRGKAPKASAPIWSSKCKDVILNGRNWLNGVAVDPADGFTGAPEVFTFQPASEGATDKNGSTGVKAFGYYDTPTNEELLGEILLYNRVLDEAERRAVEAYLMGKWLGRLPAGFMDFRQMTVSGSGVVAPVSQRALPKFGAAFTGDVDLAALEKLSFTVPAEGTAASNLLDAGNGRLKLPAETPVVLAFDARPRTGVKYALLVGDLAAETAFVLDAASELKGQADGKLSYDPATKTLSYEAIQSGTVLIFR